MWGEGRREDWFYIFPAGPGMVPLIGIRVIFLNIVTINSFNLGIQNKPLC
jgi:hypothetical protein